MRTLTTLILSILFFGANAQQTINASIMHDNQDREYILYVPANYTGDEAVPLVFNFHGYTGTANDQMWYGDFRPIADTAGFLVVHPQGSLLNGITHWNVGGWTVGSTADDIGFTNALIDTLAAQYNINLERVYSTGMSNGGYMSFLLACQLSDRIAAIASVTGSMTPETYNQCNPQRPVPVMQIHGTDDSVVPYNGAAWSRSITDAMDYWITHNNCSQLANIEDVPDIDMTDGSTVEWIVNEGGDAGVVTEHFKIYGGDHTWPGSAFNIDGTNYDIDASWEIWRFFSQYDINGLIEVTNTEELNNTLSVKLYPNPVHAILTIELSGAEDTPFELLSLSGQQLMSGMIQSDRHTINMESFPQGVYFLRMGTGSYKVVKL